MSAGQVTEAIPLLQELIARSPQMTFPVATLLRAFALLSVRAPFGSKVSSFGKAIGIIDQTQMRRVHEPRHVHRACICDLRLERISYRVDVLRRRIALGANEGETVCEVAPR